MNSYIGDGKDIGSRIREGHCTPNVESSTLRQIIAVAMGYNLKKTKRSTSSSIQIRIDIPNPTIGEANVTSYITSGEWKYVICASPKEANDFQWYAIERFEPSLNRRRKKVEIKEHYQNLYDRLINNNSISINNLYNNIPSLAGVYLFMNNKPIPSFI